MSLLFEILAQANSQGGGEGTPYNGLYGDDPPEKGYFFQASSVLGNLSFGLIKRLKRANRCISWLRQRFIKIFKTKHLKQLKGFQILN